jgi:taurine dioxygenase
MNVNVAYQTGRDASPSASRATPFEVEPLGRHLGAEVHGLNLKNGMDPDTFRAFEAALIEHKVLVVRDQNLTTAEHVAISRLFGELEVHPFRPQGEFPEVLVLAVRRAHRGPGAG